MKLLLVFQILSALVTKAYGCPDGHSEYVNSPRGEPQQATITPPTRPLEWGDINIIHTTDSHGWLLGHQKLSSPEPNYRYVVINCFRVRISYDRQLSSGNFGDFAFFVSRMKTIAEVKSRILVAQLFTKLIRGPGTRCRSLDSY